MADTEVRVALLARAGNARDQLHRALDELGARLVAEGDPAELDPDEVTRQAPTLVVISLEPATEAALDRFDALLGMPGVEVMFDDAEVTRQLDGWDLNRWARHLAAKMLGRDVLPPPPGDADRVPVADLTPVPGAPPTPAQLMDDARFEEYAQDAPELAEWVPTEPSLAQEPASAPAESVPERIPMATGPEPEISFEMDMGDLEAALQQIDSATAPAPQPEASDELTLDNDFPLDIDLSHLESASTALPTSAPEETLVLEEDATTLADFEMPAEPVRFSKFDEDAPAEQLGDLDADVAALAAQLEAFEKSDTRQAARDPDFAFAVDPGEQEPQAEALRAPAPAPAPVAAREAAPAPRASSGLDFSNLSLAGDDVAPVPTPSPAASAAKSGSSLDSLGLSLEPMDDAPSAPAPAAAKAAPKIDFGSLSLEGEAGETAAAPARAAAAGVVVVLAGLGGPDAVRQLLSGLPENLPVPVLLYQHLDVGKHDRLAEQLGKISRLPVQLASAGGEAGAGKVSLLPSGMAASYEQGVLRFQSGSLAELLAAIPAADSVVVALSGADAELVPAMLAVRQAGGLALAQDPENCFDPAAVQMLQRQGAATFPSAGLAQQIASRWP